MCAKKKKNDSYLMKMKEKPLSALKCISSTWYWGYNDDQENIVSALRGREANGIITG